MVMGYISWSAESKQYTKRVQSLIRPGDTSCETICIGYIEITQKTAWGVMGKDNIGNEFLLVTDSDKFKLGERYSFKGAITPEGKIDVLNYQHHPHRSLKYVFSSLSLLLVLFLVGRFIRIERSSLMLILMEPDKGFIGKRK